MVRFIHAADLHLDSPFSGLQHLPDEIWKEVRESTFQSLHTIIEHALNEEVDFVLFAGDIYDIEDRSVKAQAQFKQEMERLKEADIPVCIIHGNHDFLSDTSLHLSLPENVTVLGNDVETVEWVTKDQQRVALTGFSYDKRWVNDRKVREYPTRSTHVDRHIGLLHGFKEGEKADHAKYAPFSLAELQEKRYDYWALGHIHKREQISKTPLAYYPGNIQGRHRHESGEKGCLLVDLSKAQEPEVTFLSTAPIQWIDKNVHIETIDTLGEVFDQVRKQVGEGETSRLVNLTLVVPDDLSPAIRRKLNENEFLEALYQKKGEKFDCFVSLRLKEQGEEKQLPALEKLFPEAWEKAVEDVYREDNFLETTSEFFHQAKVTSLVEQPEENYRKRIIEAAMEKLERISENERNILHED